MILFLVSKIVLLMSVLMPVVAPSSVHKQNIYRLIAFAISALYMASFFTIAVFSDVSPLTQTKSFLNLILSWLVVVLYGILEVCVVFTSRYLFKIIHKQHWRLVVALIVCLVLNISATLRWDDWEWFAFVLPPLALMHEAFIDYLLVQYPETSSNISGMFVLGGFCVTVLCWQRKCFIIKLILRDK